jgi:nucleoprotein TPR
MLDRAERSGGSKGFMTNGEMNGVHDEAGSNLVKELEEVQSQFATYRAEMGIDAVRLREDAVQSHRENARLGAELAKATANIDFLTSSYISLYCPD